MIQVTLTNRHKHTARPRLTGACTVKHRPLFITAEPHVTASVTKCFPKKRTTDPVLRLWTERQHHMFFCQSKQTACTGGNMAVRNRLLMEKSAEILK